MTDSNRSTTDPGATPPPAVPPPGAGPDTDTAALAVPTSAIQPPPTSSTSRPSRVRWIAAGVLIALYLYLKKHKDMSFLELADRRRGERERRRGRLCEYVRLADDAAYAHDLAEPLAALIVSIAGDYDAIVAPATSRFKNTLPRVAVSRSSGRRVRARKSCVARRAAFP